MSIIAAEDSTSKSMHEKDASSNFAIKIFTKSPFVFLNISNGDNEISYIPNARGSIGVSASYKGFGFSASKNLGFNDGDTDKYGKTESRDYQLYMFKKHLGVELYYQKMKGFYMDNNDSYGYSAGDAETIRPDIKIRHIGANIYYSLSDNFSLANVYDCQNPVEKSGGSFLVYLGFDVTSISSDSGFIPDKAKKDFSFAANVNSVESFNIYAGGGYTHVFVYHGFFAAASIIAAASPSISKYEMTGNQANKKSTDPVVHFNMKYSLGYNGESFIAGLYAFWHTSMYGNTECKISPTAGKIGLFAGTRF